jgi:hypothetical protein
MRTVYICALLAFVSCGEHSEGTAVENDTEKLETAPAQGAVRTDLSSEDLPFTIDTPEWAEGATPTIMWKEEFGYVEVLAGEHFGLTIAEFPGDLARKKADLERNLLQTHEILSEEDGLLIYKSSFPDNEKLVFHHFYQVLEQDGRYFVVEDLASGQYSLKEIERMASSLQPAGSI